VLLDAERETELRELVERLDRLLPRDGAHLSVAASGEGTVGNRLGYMRFGLEFLAAALDPRPASDEAPAHVAPRLESLLTDDSAVRFESCELDEAIESRPPVQSRLGAPGQLLAGVLTVAAVILLLIGASVVWRALFG
jgi:hypothetical protein